NQTVSKFYFFAWQVIQICLWCVDSGCSKHMTGNLKLLINFVWKFMGTVRFGNDHVAAIMGFGDIQWGNILITMVYFVKGLGHNLFSIGQFCDSDLEKEGYETWAMKMEYWIMNTDHNLWKIIQDGNSKKSLGRDSKGGIIILPPVSFEEHVAIQIETKARTLLLQPLPEDYMVDFHHLDDAREIWLAVKARFGEFSVSEEEGLHKGYDRFQKILSQLNRMQAKPNNDDVNIKFLRALPPSWSQVALTLKTRGGLEYLSFDDLYNKLRSLEINVKGGSSYGSRSTTVASTHSAFIRAASTNTKMVYSDQPSYSSLISYTPAPFGSIIEDVLHYFVAENEPTQQLAYEDFEQVDQLEIEELNIKWQMAMLSLRIKKFQKKAGRKINFNNKDSARFDRRKARCYNCLHLRHFARECNVKKVDEKAKYSAFKISKVKIEEPKAMVSVDSMLNWNEHDAENKTEEAEQVYGLMVGFESDFAVHAGNAAGGVNPAVVEFAMMQISPKLALEEKVRILSANLENTTNTLKYSDTLYAQAKIEKQEWEIKFVESLASKSHLIKDCHVYDTVDNVPSVVSKAASVHAGSRNSSACTSAGRSILAASRNRSASIHAGRSIPAASRNRSASIHAGRSNPAASRNRSVLVVLGEITNLICNGVPRTMVDLINLHGFILNDP
nr:ribonuclease H-like domain-containing protein [Tanacetum cinerariifolium]